MPKYARTASGKILGQPQCIERSFSNFHFIETEFEGLTTLRRIMSQVRSQGGKTMIVEQLEDSDDLREENNDIKLRYSTFSESTSYRISFYSKGFSTERDISTVAQKDFIGYAIVKKDKIADSETKIRIYESVIRSRFDVNSFIRAKKEWSCSVAGNQLRVEGCLYAQQNGITNSCSHVALRSVTSLFHKDGDMLYREMNGIVKTIRKREDTNYKDENFNPGDGLKFPEILAILKAAGAGYFFREYTETKIQPNMPPFQKYLYGSIESGFPSMVVFETLPNPHECHAIPVFGHTFNEDTWVHRAEHAYFEVGSKTRYIPSESWVTMYIGHDDNWGSNFCIPRRYLHTRRYCQHQSGASKSCLMDLGNVLYVIGTFPAQVKMDAVWAEAIGADYLFTILPQLPDFSEVWRQRLCYYASVNQLVLRPILLRSKDYSKHLYKIRDWRWKDLGFNLKIEPEEGWLWMVELSIPELFAANKRKVAEVVLRATVKPKVQRDFNNFILARVPGYFALYSKGGASNPKYHFIPCGIKDHVELYGCEEAD